MEASDLAAASSSMATDDTERAAAERRARELAEWLEKIRLGDPKAWEETPTGLNLNQTTSEDRGILLQEGSLTPAQIKKPHCISEHNREFATDAEYHAYVEQKKAWAREHCPAGVEIIPVVTADGVRTVATIGLTADQANAINNAVDEKIALEKQAALVQISEVEPTVEMPQNQPILEPGEITARVEAVATKIKIEKAGHPHAGATETIEAQVLSSTPHPPEMQEALRQALTVGIEEPTTSDTALVVTHRKMPKAPALGRTA
jgi:hypothetical protein